VCESIRFPEKVTKFGIAPMPSISLTDTSVADVVAFIVDELVDRP
jgi:hypothetical protein